MRGFSWRPLVIPTLIGLVTGFALLAALLSDGLLETISVMLLGGVLALVAFHLFRRRPRS